MKEVKIIGLTINKQFGILQACNLTFDNENRLITVKGGVGEGKTTLQKSLQLGTQGSKTLIDKNLYGKIDAETQLLDGKISIWVGCRSDKKGRLIYTIYTKDNNGKIVKEPIIDGVKATPAKYLETLQTELTWKMNELTSENPTVQKKILLKLYQHKLKEIGVIFDKNIPGYSETILGKIDKAEANRDMTDALRKQYGGIAEDLKTRGFDVHRPETIPNRINLQAIEGEIKELEKSNAVAESEAKAEKNDKLQKIKIKAAELTGQCIGYNAELKTEYDKKYSEKKKKIEQWVDLQQKRTIDIDNCNKALCYLQNAGYKGNEVDVFINLLPESQLIRNRPINDVKEPRYILIENNKVITQNFEDIELVFEIKKLRREYQILEQEEVKIDIADDSTKLTNLQIKLENSKKTNKICNAIDSFFDWQKANEDVIQLKKQYIKLLATVNTGIDGLRIVPEENDSGKLDIYLMYNGSYDPNYFNNLKLEYRKLSSYSGTQKPVVCLLIQNYLLNQKPKSMRYMYIDNIPMDSKTIELLRTICYELKLRIFLNITGNFEQSKLNENEFLIEGGEVFFNKINN